MLVSHTQSIISITLAVVRLTLARGCYQYHDVSMPAPMANIGQQSVGRALRRHGDVQLAAAGHSGAESTERL